MIVDYTLEMQREIEAFFEIVVTASGRQFDPEGRHSSLRNIGHVYPRDRGGFWVCKINGKITGTVAIKEIDEEYRICELKSMYVLPEYQGKGYGKKLLKYALGKVCEKGYTYIRLDTVKTSEKAVNLYKSVGFYEIKRYNDNTFADLFMEYKVQ